jgi:hypothetical protein
MTCITSSDIFIFDITFLFDMYDAWCDKYIFHDTI